ncbi:MAG: response regulator [Lachnospiraceae bacterium]|nr:response regulator [Lachnospiraceae bacterium]
MDDKLTILAVDDNSISLATIEQEFKGIYEVVALNSGVRALQYLKQQTPPDLILLDIQMAPKDGIETLREIREMKNCQDIPVIMLTSQREKQTILESSKLGINDYVLKPFKTQDLHDRIESILKAEKDKRSNKR